MVWAGFHLVNRDFPHFESVLKYFSAFVLGLHTPHRTKKNGARFATQSVP